MVRMRRAGGGGGGNAQGGRPNLPVKSGHQGGFRSGRPNLPPVKKQQTKAAQAQPSQLFWQKARPSQAPLAKQAGQRVQPAGQRPKKIFDAFATQARQPANQSQAGREGKACKWCEMGECWSHGQIEKPEAPKKPRSANSDKNGPKGKGKGQSGKNAAKNGPKGQGKGQWVFVPSGGGGRAAVQQHHLKQVSSAAERPNPKNLLSSGLRLLLDRNVTKDDCVYEVTEEKGKFVALLQVAALTTERTEFKGKPAGDAKTAEANAAQKCVNVLSKEIQEARTAHEAVQAEKHAARQEALKEKRAEEKAAKEA